MNESVLRDVLMHAQEGDFDAARWLEDEIEQRGLQEAYCRALAHQYSGVLLRDYTWALLRATPEQRARAFVEATKER